MGTYPIAGTLNPTISTPGVEGIINRGGIPDSFTSLLLHADGTGASFVDSSFSPKTVTANGAVTQNATHAKWGNSAFFNFTANTFLSIPDDPSLQLGGGSFTIDFWIYPASFGANQVIYCKKASAGNVSLLIFLTAGHVTLYASSNGTTWNMFSGINFGDLTLTTLQHVALVRNGNVWTLYVNGTSTGTQTVAGTLFDNGSAVAIGAYTDGISLFTGYIDEFRISKGIARWTANFTPPTAPY